MKKIFLYQNLHAQINYAAWGLLHENTAIYAASLAQASNWIKQYFVQDSQTTQFILQQLTELQKINVKPASTTLSNTLQLFDHAKGVS